ncbi:MAG: hypothetical protein RIR70_1902 [Pseudomonadota bacterium]|jgi:tRNA(Ile)-lysidine synthase
MANSRNKPPPETLVDTLGAALEKWPLAGRHLCVGLSGGVDSVALLAALHALAPGLHFRLSAVHVNHGLSPNAPAWAAFCARLCESLAVPLTIEAVQVCRQHPDGLEAAAREARYRAFGRIDADFLVLAHHRADQAETVLHRLVRGAGAKGLSAMRAEGALFGQGSEPAAPRARLLRPLLGFGKAELSDYAQHRGLGWVEDESNLDTAYARNFLRAQILPALNERFPGAEKTLARAATLFAETDDLLADLARLDLAAALQSEEGRALSQQKLIDLGEPRARNLIRYLLGRLGEPLPDHDKLSEALRQLFFAQPDRQPLLSFGRVRLTRFDGAVYFLREVMCPPCQETVWAGEAVLPWALGRIEFLPTFGEGIASRWMVPGQWVISARQEQARLPLGPNRPSKTIKQIFQSCRVPPWERAGMPFFWRGEELAAVGDIALHPRYACQLGEPGVKIVWRRPDMVLSLQAFALS